jgi:electron transfer flavoprotein alpha subunit
MAKTINLKQLSEKKYTHITGLLEQLSNTLGLLEDSFDMLIHGPSGNGKTSFTAQLLKELIKSLKCRAEYITYEEGHGMTVQENFIHRHKFLEELGNVMQLTEHYTFEELMKRMSRKQSAKIWVIDSLQAAGFTYQQTAELKRKFVNQKKKKIIIYISWSDGKNPNGANAKAVEYYANIKVRVEGFIAFPRSRYGGNMPFVIWEKNARQYWGVDFKKHSKNMCIEASVEKKTTKKIVNKIQVLPRQTEEEKILGT